MTTVYLVMRAESYGTQQVYWVPEKAFTTRTAAEHEAGRYGKVITVPVYSSETREG